MAFKKWRRHKCSDSNWLFRLVEVCARAVYTHSIHATECATLNLVTCLLRAANSPIFSFLQRADKYLAGKIKAMWQAGARQATSDCKYLKDQQLRATAPQLLVHFGLCTFCTWSCMMYIAYYTWFLMWPHQTVLFLLLHFYCLDKFQYFASKAPIAKDVHVVRIVLVRPISRRCESF